MKPLLFSLLTIFTFHLRALEPAESKDLTDLATAAVKSAQAEFPADNIKDDDVAITLIDLRDPAHPTTGNFRGQAKFYPASVVKLFYLAAAERSLADGKLTDTPELRRGLHDMIVDSDNAACQYILDSVTEAPNGHELSPPEMEKWAYKRNAVNRYFASLGYANINTNQKTYIEGPYGLDKIFLGPNRENRNALTSSAAAKLMLAIVTHDIVSPKACDEMLELLQRDMTQKSAGPDDQAHGFTAQALSPTDRLWSKAGWTNTARHDVAYVETDSGQKMVLSIFTINHATNRKIIPSIARQILTHAK
jgi:beta-lactamase class A